MGCTLTYTLKDHTQAMRSLARRSDQKNPPVKVRRSEIRQALHKAGRLKLIDILKDPHHDAYKPLCDLLIASMNSQMTNKELDRLPDAFKTVLMHSRNIMGLFEKAPSHRAPGTSPVQHHYEILSAAAMMKSAQKTISGKTLVIDPLDKVDFGIKFARDYAQPRIHGTIEADILIHKGPLNSERTVAIDTKFSKTGKYHIKDKGDFNRQLSGIRTGLRDGKVDAFHFVTNGKFSDTFKCRVDEENIAIAKDWAAQHNRIYGDVDPNHMAEAERNYVPAGKIPESFFNQEIREVKTFVNKHNIPQIDLCQYVKYPGT